MAYGMAKLFGRWANLVTALVAVPLADLREHPACSAGSWSCSRTASSTAPCSTLFGISVSGFLYSVPAIVLGLVYVYLPFMLFPW